MMTAGGVLGGALSFAFGDVGPLLWWLVIFTTADFFLGTGVALLQGKWSSHKNYLGVLKKALMFAIVALAHGLDEVFAPVIHFQIFQSIKIKRLKVSIISFIISHNNFKCKNFFCF